jgi:hypothetical protein
MIIRRTLSIARPVEDVYRLLVDQERWAVLDPALVAIEPRGTIAEGTSGTVTRRVSGMKVTTAWTITELDEPTRLAMRIVGRGYVLTDTTTLEATAEGTRATIVDELEPTARAGRLFVALSGPFIRRDLDTRASRLTSLLESEGDVSLAHRKP